MFQWRIKATNAIYLQDANGKEGRPFKSRFLQAGLVKYDFGVCLLKKETIDKFVNTFVGTPVIINHKDNISEADKVGTINNIWFSAEDGWYWCDGIITDEEAVKLIEQGYNVSCQYRITDYADNTEGKLHNANPYDKEILDGVFEHLAIVENPRYEDAFIAVNAYIATNNDFNEDEYPRDEKGKFTDGNKNINQKFNDEIDKIKSGEYPRGKQITVSEKPSDVWIKAGLQNKKIVMPTAVFHKATTEKHNVDEETIRKFPELLQDPPFIFKSSTEPGAYVGVLDATEKDGENEKPLVVAVKPVKDRVEVNIITSTYGKDKDFIRRETAKGNLLYKRKKTATNSIVASLATETLKPPNTSITDNSKDFNPIVTINKETNYDKVFDYIRNTKGESMDNETKGLLAKLTDALLARNEAEEKDEKDKKDETASNADTDKRKLIDEIGGILKGKVDEELWRTIIGKAEKIAYDKSEAGTADNKAKNEDEEPSKEDEKKDDKEEAKNKCKNADDRDYKKLYEELKEETEKAAENKAKNSMDELVNGLYSIAKADTEPAYISPKKGLELGEQIYGAK